MVVVVVMVAGVVLLLLLWLVLSLCVCRGGRCGKWELVRVVVVVVVVVCVVGGRVCCWCGVGVVAFGSSWRGVLWLRCVVVVVW